MTAISDHMTAPPHATPPEWAGPDAVITTLGYALVAGWEWAVTQFPNYWWTESGGFDTAQLVVARPVPEPTVTVDIPRTLAEHFLVNCGDSWGPTKGIVALIRAALDAEADE